MKQYKLTDNLKANRNVLKRFIRNHAKKFDMAPVISTKSNPAALGFFENLSPEQRLSTFEECGTACCVYGAALVLSDLPAGDASDVLQERFFGRRIFPIMAGAWTPELYLEYGDAKIREDYKGMAAAACKAIDYYAKQ